MRIVSGTARRLPLIAPQGLNTRPTSDRAKEGLFNILGARVVGTSFLDLFCGSGAIGLEAVSRGAKNAVFVEQAKPALTALAKNITTTKLAGEVLALPVAQALQQLDVSKRKFNIIFFDPPYVGGAIEEVLALLTPLQIYEENCLIIAETQKSLIFTPIESFILETQRDYGQTRFLFFRIKGEPL